MASDREALERAAAGWGVELEYTDTWGRRHAASEETLRATLAALKVPADSDAELERAAQERDLARWSRAFDPAVVVFEDSDSIALRIPAGRAGASVKVEFGWENGDLEHHWFWLPELQDLERVSIAGREFVSKRVPLPALRLGYHQLRVYWMKAPELEAFEDSRLIVCPRRARMPEGRMAGIGLSLYGLRSSRNWGCGDFSDLRAAIDVLAPAGAAFIALNPLHAIPNRQPYNTSPYLPHCSLYRNFLYLDVERVPGFLPQDTPSPEVDALRLTELVEYERVAAIKLQALRKAFDRFQAAGQTEELDEFAHVEGVLLHHFALFSVLDEHIHRQHPDIWLWKDWPEQFRDAHSAAVAEFSEQHRDDILFYKFLQWQVDRQLAEAQDHAMARGMKIGLYHDLALATDRFGADLWMNARFYGAGARVGAPPDELAPSGQDWGFPPPDREAHRENGYELFAQSIRKNARHGGALRIDHVMRFFRLFWIPDGLTAAQGAYVRDYAEDLLGILALESARGGFVVIGEDLGTVEWSVRHKLGEMGILGYRVLWFEKNPDGSFRLPHEYPQQAAISTTTHDLPTLAGFAQGRDIEARRAAGLVDEAGYQQQWATRREELGRLDDALQRAGFAGDPVGFVLATPCALAIVNQEDLTGETEQQNLPASTWQHPNWRRKMRVTVEEMGPMAEDLRRRLERAGRI
ncbi:MAG TPA: 4-alpha-glucanotransferase [Bryobacteraceae bacterium]|nr:4-alpha-glucanotransferase [Bryobacteraceae bacterium]